MSNRFDIANKRTETDYYELKKLREQHHAIIRMKFANPAISGKEIAEALGITAQMVYYTLNSEQAKNKLAVMRGYADEEAYDAQAEIRSLSPMAIQTLAQIMMDKNESGANRRLAASDLLDRNPQTSTKSTVEHKHETNRTITADELAEIKQQARASGTIKDADYEDITEPRSGTKEDNPD